MFCLNYYPFQNSMHNADQLKIKYKSGNRTLQEFLINFQDKTIIIDVTAAFEQIDAQLLQGLFKKFKNIKLLISFDNKEHLSRVKRYNIPYFFIEPVTTIDQLNGFMKYQPTDMYICEQLGFSLDKISKLLHDNNIKVRVFPNICQSSFKETPSIKTFFIRPEDIKFYSTFVDVFELVSNNAEIQNTLFKIYKQQKWFGKIKQIIPTYKGELDSKYLLDSFGAIRCKCGKRCMYKPQSCNICDRFIELADTFEQNKIVIRTAKKKN